MRIFYKALPTGLATLSFLATCLAVGAVPAGATFLPATPPVFGSPGVEAGQFAAPTAIATNDATGDVYVTDPGVARVDEFSQEGTFIRAWGWGVLDGEAKLEVCEAACLQGLQGSEAGQLNNPVAIAVDNSTGASSGDVYVADAGNNKVQVFGPAGEWLGVDNDGSTAPQGSFKELKGVAVDGSGDLWTIDSNTGNVDEFDAAGTYVPGSEFADGYAATKAIAVNTAGSRLYLMSGVESDPTEAWDPTDPAAKGTLLNDGGSVFASLKFRGTSLAVDPASGDLYVEDFGFGGTFGHFTTGSTIVRYNASGTELEHFGGPEVIAAAPEGAVQGIAFDPAATLPGTAGALYALEDANADVRIFGPPPAIPPSVDAAFAGVVNVTSAELHGTVNPNYFETHAHFEYVTAAQFQASGFTEATATATLDLGSTGGTTNEQPLYGQLHGLAAATTYDYRIIATGDVNGTPETAPGIAQTFTTLAAPLATTPPAQTNPPAEGTDAGVTPPPPVVYPNLTTLKPIPAAKEPAGKPKTKAKPCKKGLVKHNGKCVKRAKAKPTHHKGSN